MLTYGMRDAKVATRNATDDYGTAVDVPNVQMMNATMRVMSGEATGDDRIVAVASRFIAGQMQIRMQGAPLEALAVVTGIDPIVVGVTPNTVTTLRFPAGHRLPAFGIVGQGLEEEGLGDQLIFVPNAKITSDVTLGGFEYGQFQTVEFTAMAIDDETYGAVNLIQRETTDDAYTLPPANIVEVP